ncbi:OsmC family protein [Occallatibacter savannae]|uniref:OsmC family protein n=1 Tax=Occallatibacter savannae TaxID=1002691 RepID=UPI000D68D354|nr:OsmC family protein [Occallatibacter savannae]
MNISATVENRRGSHAVSLAANGREHGLAIAPKSEGLGSSVNGGELLFLALATCYCNDLYREAKKRNIELDSVRVEVTGEFGAEGEGAKNVSYRASVDGRASQEELLNLMRHTDTVAEIQNTLRFSVPVKLAHVEARTI